MALALQETDLDLDLLVPAGLQGDLGVGHGLHTEHEGTARPEVGERRAEKEVEVGGQETVHCEDVVGDFLRGDDQDHVWMSDLYHRSTTFNPLKVYRCNVVFKIVLKK